MHESKEIEVIHSPYHHVIADMSIQPKGAQEIEGQIIVDTVTRTELCVISFMDTQQRGVFSTRSPLRPNHMLKKLTGCKRVVPAGYRPVMTRFAKNDLITALGIKKKGDPRVIVLH